MLKLLGSVCVLSAGVLARYRMASEERRTTKTLADLAAALEFMGDDIRINRTAMPRLLLKAGSGRGGETMAFFAAVRLKSAEQGLAEAWRSAAEVLALPGGEKIAVAEVGTCLLGDEEQACRGLAAAAEALRRELEQRKSQAAETAKRGTALCFSASALIIILLI